MKVLVTCMLSQKSIALCSKLVMQISMSVHANIVQLANQNNVKSKFCLVLGHSSFGLMDIMMYVFYGTLSCVCVCLIERN